MAAETSVSRKSDAAAIIPWRGLMAAVVALAVGWGGIVYAANNSVQGAPKKEDGGFDGDAPTAILIEASSGSVLFEKNADELRAPSSMMKLMTVEVVFNAIKEGKIKLTDEYRISENAWRKGGAPAGGSTMFAILNSKVSVDDLLHGAIIQSGNDSCIALAEGMAGNERIFAADFMTKRARELGLTKSTFGNSNGLPDPANRMTVRELAKLARHLILTYPDMYKLFGEKEFTWNKIRQQNRNPLLNTLNGADGLKTGYTKEGGYGMVGSAVQNDTRLIVVINGLEDPDDRASEAKKMLEWGFRNFETRTLFAANQQVGYAKVFGGESRSVKLASPQPIKVMVPKNGSEKLIARIVYNGPVRAPVQAGQPVGVVRVWRGANVADGGAGLCRGSGRHRLDHAPRDRRRQRTRHRHVPRERREALSMNQATLQRPSGRGKFITFEGGEGSGKSTQIKKLAERLAAAKLRAIVTREPGGSPGAEIMRHLVLSGMGKLLGPDAETLLFAAARDDHVRTVIQPALGQGTWVLCDRFSDSTRAYQGRLGQVAPGVLNAMQRVTIGDLKPDLTIILDIPVEVGLQRAAARRGSGVPDRFESEDLQFHQDLRDAYRQIAAEDPQRCVLIDANADADTVAARVWTALRDHVFAVPSPAGTA